MVRSFQFTFMNCSYGLLDIIFTSLMDQTQTKTVCHLELGYFEALSAPGQPRNCVEYARAR